MSLLLLGRSRSKALLLSTVTMTLSACANGPCHPVRNPELADQPRGKAVEAAPIPGTIETPSGEVIGGRAGKSTAATPAVKAAPQKTTPSQSAATSSGGATVLVAKPDGSLQCGMGKAVSPQEMEKQLPGIRVLSRSNRPDGLMHIQVCGSPTGMVNVYEIPASSLKAAEAKGFKRFNPES